MPFYPITDARMQARSGLCVSGLSRSDDFWWPRAYVTIAGTDRTALVRRGLTVNEQNGDGGSSCSFVIDGSVTPAKGAEVIIGLGSADNRIFGGHVINRRLGYLGNIESLSEYTIECAGYAWLLSFRMVAGYRPQEAADARVAWLLSTYAPSFSTSFVQTGLGNVEPRTYDLSKTVDEVLTELADEVGGWWYVDAYKHLYFGAGTGIPGTDPATVDAWTMLHALAVEETYGQLATRVWATGAGAVTSEAFSAGDSIGTIAIEDGTALAGVSVQPSTPTSYALSGYATVDGTVFEVLSVEFNDPGWAITVTEQAADHAMPTGAAVTLLSRANDAAAQATAAAAIGSGDGIRESRINASRERTGIDALDALTAAELNVTKDGETTAQYRTREKHHRAGRTVTFSLAPLSAALTIQAVTLTDLEGPKTLARWPMATVTAGETYRNFTRTMRTRMLS